MAKKIKQFGFFSYSANETLHLSNKEKETVISIFRIIEDELNSKIDELSHDVVIFQIELLLFAEHNQAKKTNILFNRFSDACDGEFQTCMKDFVSTCPHNLKMRDEVYNLFDERLLF